MSIPTRRLLSTLVSAVIVPSALVPRRARRELLRLWGVQVLGRVEVRHGFDVLTPKLSLGDAVFINRGVVINNTAQVTLEHDVALGPGVLITTSHHEVGSPARRQGAAVPLPVHVAAGTWIGARVVILPGVSIGPGCVVAAGAVVNRDCAANGLYGGVPARRIRDLEPAGSQASGEVTAEVGPPAGRTPDVLAEDVAPPAGGSTARTGGSGRSRRRGSAPHRTRR